MRQRSVLTLFILTSFLFTLTTSLDFKKGCSGTYYISGKIYTANKIALKSVQLTVKIGDDSKTIQTDSKGHYEIDVHWNSTPSTGSKGEVTEATEKMNPPVIYIRYAGKVLKVDNQWEKYANCFPESKEQMTWKTDLYFTE